jgi:uncharacterized repeat protein (TIGR01451 family)
VNLAAVGASERLAPREIGAIEPGQARTFAVSTGAARGANQVALTATAKAVCAREVSDQAAVAMRTIPALLLEAVDRTDPIRVGANTTYTITVRNQGSGADHNIAVKATLPPEMRFVRGGGASEVRADGQNLTFAPVPTLEPKADATWTVEVTGVRPGDLRFAIEMTSASLTQPVVETESTRVVGDAATDPGAEPAAPGAAPAPAPRTPVTPPR